MQYREKSIAKSLSKISLSDLDIAGQAKYMKEAAEADEVAVTWPLVTAVLVAVLLEFLVGFNIGVMVSFCCCCCLLAVARDSEIWEHTSLGFLVAGWGAPAREERFTKCAMAWKRWPRDARPLLTFRLLLPSGCSQQQPGRWRRRRYVCFSSSGLTGPRHRGYPPSASSTNSNKLSSDAHPICCLYLFVSLPSALLQITSTTTTTADNDNDNKR